MSKKTFSLVDDPNGTPTGLVIFRNNERIELTYSKDTGETVLRELMSACNRCVSIQSDLAHRLFLFGVKSAVYAEGLPYARHLKFHE